MTMTTFTATLACGEVLTGTVERAVTMVDYVPVDYARVRLTGAGMQLNFSRDLVTALGDQGALSVSEDLWVDTLNECGSVIARELVDVSGGRPHCVELAAAGEWGEIVRRALAAVKEAA